MTAKTLQKIGIPAVIVALFISAAFAEVEIYKAGKRYIPGEENIQTSTTKEESAKDANTKTKVEIEEIIKKLEPYFNKEQIGELQKIYDNQNLELGNYEIGNYEIGNYENIIGNYTNSLSR